MDIHLEKEKRLNHLLFIDDLKLYGSNDNEIDSLLKVVTIVSGATGMQFGFEKSAVLKKKMENKLIVRVLLYEMVQWWRRQMRKDTSI